MDSARNAVQVQHVARLSLAELERLAVEMEAEGRRRTKCGLVVLKRSAGRGRETSRLVCMIEAAWHILCGRHNL